MSRKDRRAGEKGAISPQAQAPARAPAETDRLFQLALKCHQTGKFADAEGMYRHILSGNPRHIDALHLLGVLALQSGRPQVAVDMIGKAIALNDRMPAFHSNIAEALRTLGRFDEAAPHLIRALALDPNFIEAHLNLGNVRRLQGQLDEAIEHYRRAVQIHPNYADAHLNLGVALVDKGNVNDAMIHLGKALALKPRAPEVHANIGIALGEARDWERATAHYRESLKLRPDHPETTMNFGHALLSQGKVEEAVVTYETALRLMARRAGGDDPDLPAMESLWMALQGKRAISFAEENCLLSLSRALCWGFPVTEWRGIADRAMKQDGLSPAARYELLMRRAIQQWVYGDESLPRTLEQGETLFAMLSQPINKNVRNSRAYAEFLASLSNYARNNPGARAADPALTTLPVIGDSHSLSYDRAAVTVDGEARAAKAHLIMGCKAWHLGDEKPNHYKWLFSRIVKEIPPGSPVVLSFGEIDCRVDEGILPFIKAEGGELDEVVGGQVERYVGNVLAMTKDQELKLYVMGVPAPNVAALTRRHPQISADDFDLVVRIIKSFNTALEAALTRAGHRYLDMHRVSTGADGRASGEAHLDDYHLKPDALAQALA